MRRSLVVSLALLAIVRSPAVAQTCMGLASFSNAPMQVTGNAQFSSPRDAYGATVGYGMQSGLWGNLGIQTLSISGATSHPLNIGAHAGYETALGKSRNPISVCPNASFSVGNGPDAPNFNNSTQDVTLGVNFGTMLPGSNPRMRIVPTAGISWAHNKFSSKDSLGVSRPSVSGSYGLAQLGVGLVMNQNISIRPSVDIPLKSGYSTGFGVTLGYNFGSKGAAPARRR
jgi:hypothetical protein